MLTALAITVLFTQPDFVGQPAWKRITAEERQPEGHCGATHEARQYLPREEDSAGIWIAAEDNGPDYRW